MLIVNCAKCKKSSKISGAEINELAQANKSFVCAECLNKKPEETKVKVVEKKVAKKVPTRKDGK